MLTLPWFFVMATQEHLPSFLQYHCTLTVTKAQ